MHPPESGATHLQNALKGGRTFRDLGALEKQWIIGQATALIDFRTTAAQPQEDGGTGFLLPGGWLLTCRHVLPTVERARDARAYFGFKRDHQGYRVTGIDIKFAPDQGYFRGEGEGILHDWALIRLDPTAALSDFGHVVLSPEIQVKAGDEASIIQHPSSKPAKIADGTLSRTTDAAFLYHIETENGSSGAAVINVHGDVIALHNRGHDSQNNGGIPIAAIIAELKAMENSPWPEIEKLGEKPLRVGIITNREQRLVDKPPQRIAATRLISRHTAEDFLGRENELALLDAAWSGPQTINLLSIIAWGGVGKTALLAYWVQSRFTVQNWLNADGQPGPMAYFDWTFYDQGTRSADATHAGAASLGSFFQKALEHFGDPDPANPEKKDARLAALIQAQRSLLILDGLEPLQYPPNHPQAGQLTDPDLRELLGLLAQRNPGLCLVSSRQILTDFPGGDTSPTRQHDLEELPVEVAVRLLRKMRITGTDEELQQAATDYFCHALSLIVLGRFLFVKGGDIRIRKEITLELANENRNQRITRNAWHVLEAYEQWLASPQGNAADAQALRLTGLFDRPASPDCLAALRKAPSFPGLTDALVPLSDDAWNAVFLRLHEAYLIQLRFPPVAEGSFAPGPEPHQVPLDAHPLIREYFAKQLREQKPEAFRAAHSRLFDHLCQTTEHRPDTLEGLQPLYQAVVHGCLASRQQETMVQVYDNRILRGTGNDGFYSQRTLGAIGADLGAVAAFFDAPWSRLSPNLHESAQAWLLNQAAVLLRALGRLTESWEPMRVGLEMAVEAKDWKNAAIRASNLSELEVTLGLLGEAVASARRALAFADQSGERSQLITKCSVAADALHQRGALSDRTESRGLFEQAETLQSKPQNEFDLLYSLPGFRYCDLILSPAEQAAWQALGRAGGSPSVSDVAPETPGISPASGGTQAATRSWQETATGGQDVRPTQALAEAERRARQTLEWASQYNLPLLDIALDHLTLERVALYRALLDPYRPSTYDLRHVTAALGGLRQASGLHHLPKALLTAALHHHVLGQDPAAARRCLDEAQLIAERGPMPLYLADVYLHRARLVGSIKDAVKRQKSYPGIDPKAELAKARAIIQKHDYGRRTEELANAEAAALHL